MAQSLIEVIDDAKKKVLENLLASRADFITLNETERNIPQGSHFGAWWTRPHSSWYRSRWTRSPHGPPLNSGDKPGEHERESHREPLHSDPERIVSKGGFVLESKHSIAFLSIVPKPSYTQ